MIKFDQVSIRLLEPFNNFELAKLFKDNNVKSFDDVLKLMIKYPSFPWEILREKFISFEKDINMANKNNKEAKIYLVDDYKDKTLIKQNQINLGNVLLLDNPTDYCSRYFMLKNKAIEKIKDDLAHTNAVGENIIASDNIEYKKIGYKYLPIIQNAIILFQEQIERQSLLTDERDINLFTFNIDEKKEIVNDLYKEIIMYLLENAKESFIWSNLSDTQRKKYLSSINSSTSNSHLTKENMISYIASYTTLNELEKVANHDYKVLKRFIKK